MPELASPAAGGRAHRPQSITFAGVDEHTSTLGLQLLSEMYPVEWGIFFDPLRQGTGRHPPLWAVEKIAALPLRTLSAHLCGKYVDEFIETGTVLDLQDLMLAFSRIHLHTSSTNLDWRRIARFGREWVAPVVLRCPEARFPIEHGITWLFDRRGPEGQPPAEWPDAPADGRLVGYAGHVGPQSLDAIARRGKPFFLQFDDDVRDHLDRFSLDKCTVVLHRIYGGASSCEPEAAPQRPFHWQLEGQDPELEADTVAQPL